MSQKRIEILGELIPVGSRVLDLGCGDGAFLEYLQKNRQCFGYGIELNAANVASCIDRGVNVLQLNLEEGLRLFEDQSFDVVLQIDTLQHLRNAETMLKETARVGKMGVVAYPNFAQWTTSSRGLKGRMAVSKHLPYEWYDTPNIRVATFNDFQDLAQKNKLHVSKAFGLVGERTITLLANLLASTAVFTFSSISST